MEPLPCPHCDAVNPPQRQHCAQCGESLSRTPGPTPPPFDASEEILTRVGALQERIAQKPEASALYLQLSQVYADAGRRDLAREVVRRLLDRDPKNVYVRHRLEQLERPPTPVRPRATRPAVRRPPPSGPVETARDLIARHPGRSAAVAALVLLVVASTWWLWPGTRRIVGGEGQAFHPEWSPRGDHVAFLIEDGAGVQLAVYDVADDSHRVIGPISGWGDESFAWSPDGLRIAYVAPSEGDDWRESIALADVITGTTSRVVSGSSPLWFADASTLYAQCSLDSFDYEAVSERDWGPRLCRIDVATGSREELGTLPGWRVAFSPTLGKLAFESFAETGDGDALYSGTDEEFQDFVDSVVRDDPSNVAKGTRNLSRELEARNYMEERSGGGESLYGTDVYVRDVGGGSPTRLTHDGRSSLVSWTPDGLRLLYGTQEGSATRIWSTEPDGGDRRIVLDVPLGVGDPRSVSLSGDGRYAFFVSSVEANPGVAKIMTGEDPADLYVARIGSSSAKRLANEHPFKQRFAVSPDGERIVYEVLVDTRGLRGGGRSELWLMSR
jgi:Tol biopolymer transport system component